MLQGIALGPHLRQRFGLGETRDEVCGVLQIFYTCINL